MFITVVSVAIELILGMAIALIMHRAIFGRGRGPHLGADPLRDRHGGRRVRLAVRVRARHRVCQHLPLSGSTRPGSAAAWSAMAVIIMAEVWKTTPFMALLLLAGMTTIDEGLYEAAKVDGANAVQRFFRITLPLMKPAILVALLFRTLDAFRIFDNIFIMTRGAQNTESVSILGYNQIISRTNLGLGSAVSVLIFIMVLLIAFVFVPAASASAWRREGQGPRCDRGTGNTRSGASRSSLVLVFALIPIVWIVSLSLKTPESVTDGRFLPAHWTLDNYKVLFQGGFDNSPFIHPLINSIAIG